MARQGIKSAALLRKTGFCAVPAQYSSERCVRCTFYGDSRTTGINSFILLPGFRRLRETHGSVDGTHGVYGQEDQTNARQVLLDPRARTGECLLLVSADACAKHATHCGKNKDLGRGG